MPQVVKLDVQVPVLLVECFLLSTLAIDLYVHHADLFSEPGHHVIVLSDLVLETYVGPIHVIDTVIQLCNAVLHLTKLVFQFPIF